MKDTLEIANYQYKVETSSGYKSMTTGTLDADSYAAISTIMCCGLQAFREEIEKLERDRCAKVCGDILDSIRKG